MIEAIAWIGGTIAYCFIGGVVWYGVHRWGNEEEPRGTAGYSYGSSRMDSDAALMLAWLSAALWPVVGVGFFGFAWAKTKFDRRERCSVEST